MAGISSYCMACLLQGEEERIRKFSDEKKNAIYYKEVCRLIGESDETASAPVLVAKKAELFEKYYGIKDDYSEQKIEFNQLMLKYEDSIWEKIQKTDDPLLSSLKYAQVGNYIDFGALRNVDQEELFKLLDKSIDNRVDEAEYESLKSNLQKGETLVYMTDNCGEIVMDKLFIRMIKETYPHLKITVLVRGEAVLNDATIEDAKTVGLTELAEVIGNGCNIAGNPVEYISEEARTLLEHADVLIAKGQGNFESLNKCGLNIFYLFLCKCSWFEMRFRMKRFEPVLVNDRNLL